MNTTKTETRTPTATTQAIIDALETQATAANDRNEVEKCWALRGMADAHEAAELDDDAVDRLYTERRAEAGSYRMDWLRGWSAVSGIVF